jgi:hypothetical protein
MVETLIKDKAIHVTSHGGSLGCETSRLPHFLDDRLTASAEFVSLTLLLISTSG